MAAGKHPFPFRTRKLSPPAPMVLGGWPPGRVGRRRSYLVKNPEDNTSGFLYFEGVVVNTEWSDGSNAKLDRSKRSSKPNRPDRSVAKAKVDTAKRDRGSARSVIVELPEEVREEVEEQAVIGSAPGRGVRSVAQLESALADAANAYANDRYVEAMRILRKLKVALPGSGSVHELLGLCLYRLGRFQEAVRELRRFASLTGSVDQHPVIADCYRALGNYSKMNLVFEELRKASPDADLLAEGRLVVAGALIEQGDPLKAIKLLEEAAGKRVSHPRSRHLRQWYVLADAHERAGHIARARELFGLVASHDPHLADVVERYEALS